MRRFTCLNLLVSRKLVRNTWCVNFRNPFMVLKRALKQWYLTFDEVVTTNAFKENIVDQCIYIKVSGSKYIFLVLYVDDISLVANWLRQSSYCLAILI